MCGIVWQVFVGHRPSAPTNADNGLRKHRSYFWLKMGLGLAGSRSFISATCEPSRRWGERGGRRPRVRSARAATASSVRVGVLPATLACARSLRYAAGLRCAVTRHVWRDHRYYACAWCSVNTGYCATSAVTMYLCWIVKLSSACILGFWRHSKFRISSAGE